MGTIFDLIATTLLVPTQLSISIKIIVSGYGLLSWFFFYPLAVFYKCKSFSLAFSFNVACSVIFSQNPNLHNSYVNCFIDSFNCKRDASSVLMEYCPESCIWKVKYLCINGACNSLLIHGFSLVNVRLLKAFGTAFYAIKSDNIAKLRRKHVYFYQYLQ